MNRSRPSRTGPRLPLLIALLALGCGAQEARPRGVLLIVVDSLRADHLGCYGHDRDTSPAIDALAAEGVLFEAAYSTAPWTVPAVASLLTGTHPSRHTVTQLGRVLPDTFETLAETLGAAGFRTAAVISHDMIGRGFRFDQGFEHFDQAEARGHMHLSSPGVTERARAVLAEFAASEDPFFLFVHYFDPHYSYRGHPRFGFAAPRVGTLTGDESIVALRDRLSELTEEEVDFLRDRYDEEIRFTDEAIGELLSALEAEGVADETVVVFTADHGEEFLGHGWLGHTRTLYEELIRVPLVVRGPGVARGRRLERPASILSIPASLLEMCDVAGPADQYQAPSIARVLRPGADEERGPLVFAEVNYVDRERGLKEAHKKAVVEGRFKLIRDDRTGKVELYDVDEDPAEQRDVAYEHPGVVERLTAALDRHLELVGLDPAVIREREFSEAELRELQELGYVELGEGDAREGELRDGDQDSD